jgi:hypothetical protein
VRDNEGNGKRKGRLPFFRVGRELISPFLPFLAIISLLTCQKPINNVIPLDSLQMAAEKEIKTIRAQTPSTIKKVRQWYEHV